MACTRPLIAYKAPSGNIKFTPYPGDEPVQLPCGQCIGCRLNHSREWAIRCTHEAMMWAENCFITLTYDNEHLPENGTLIRKHLTDFFKRLRFRYAGKIIRYFACGEYGSKLQRPHYHAILFNLDFADKRLYKSGQFPLYNSATLSELWTFGFAVVAGFSFESAAYVARYCVKKVTGKRAGEHYGDRVPEFSAMSRMPGLGQAFFYKYYDDIVNNDLIVTRAGKQCRPPRYYDKLLSGCDVELLEANKARRLENMVQVDPWRLQDIDKFNQVKFNNMMRRLENGHA